MLLMSLISYIDRNTLALLAPTILKENNLNAEQYGYIISAFSVIYTAANPIWGKLLDRYGVRAGMSIAVGFWTLASAAHAWVSGFAGFAIARAALGFGEGATFPGALRTVVQTLPERLRARGTAIAYSGGSLGAVLTPIIMKPVFEAYGWRAAFLFTGIIGIAWLVLWWYIGRMRELRVSSHSAHANAAMSARISPRDPRAWSFVVSYAMGGLPLAFVLYHSSVYFSKRLSMSQSEIASVLWIPPLGWEVGYFVWGWATDRSVREGFAPIRVYRVLTAAALLLILPLALTPHLDSFPWIMAMLFLAMFVAGGNVITTVSYATHIYTSANAGLIAGLAAGAWSALVALTMPYFGRLLDRGDYALAFWIATLCPAAGFSFWLLVNRKGSVTRSAGQSA